MTPAIVLAGVAAVCSAAAAVELWRALRAPRQRRTRRAGGRRGGGTLRALRHVGVRIGAPAAPRNLTARLAAAGMSPRITAGDVMAVKGGAALAALVAALPLAAVLPGRLAVAAAAGAPCAGFLAPDVWLRRRAAARARVMAIELPDVLDLLRVAVGAGMPDARAVAEVGRRRRGLLAGELCAAARRIELGMPRAQALAILVARCPVEEVAALAAALERAGRHGAPLGPTLAAVAAQSRARRARRLREEAARAAPKIQLVVALLLVPAAMFLVAAAALASLTP